MFFTLLRASLRFGLISALLTVVWVAVTRAAQPPMPRLLYTKNSALYAAYPGCASLLDNCSSEGDQLLNGLYSLPVAAFSPDGYSLAVHLSEHWAIYRSDCLLAKSGCKPVLLDPTINDARIAWGPNGSLLAYLDSSDTELTLMTRGCWDDNAPAGCVRRTESLTAFTLFGQQTWSADGHAMAFVSRSASAFVMLDLSCLDDQSGCNGYLHVVPSEHYPVGWPSLSPDGRKLLYEADTSGQGIHQTLFILDIPNRITHPITFRDGASFHAAWSSDARYVAFSGYATPRSTDLNLYIIDLERGLTALLMHEPGQNLDYPVWGMR
jgi:Tol biopolymer transport system component